MPTKTARQSVGAYDYHVQVDLSELNHLCTFLELSNIVMYKTQPTEDGPVQYNDLTDNDYAVFHLLLSRACFDASTKKGLLYTAVTGSKSDWGSYIDKWNRIKPLIKRLDVNSSMVLYKDTDRGYEVTMFNVKVQDEGSCTFDNARNYIAEACNKKVPEAECFPLKDSAVRTFLEGVWT